ncbi:gliding motility-associated C-terminal domain-containing protein [Chitinophaga costaii]|uniref:Gliding motility-associated C-terminal domain-containing protein n=1 Tax=Chitinophaga costaii TaxID=1335309 RepID=A0A1C4ECA0_9BACT|nr:gliding motility-associated C-terminal domain-containing protein [Chitinophaga costaii]PUZ23914.1 hypothetical protein DCM91_14085 [Chitinophaga costaii]SCC41208.1 gliding motility-associated C-terminal domain-containing protein [Chitinophaga costaii]
MRVPLPSRLLARCAALGILLLHFIPPAIAQTPLFTAPDTVCVGDPIQVSDVSTASTYFWNFCSGGFYNTPTGTNLGNPGQYLLSPVFSVTAKEGNNFYGFVSNNEGRLVKLNFGNSLLNTPTAINWNNCNGAVPNHAEGLQLAKDATGWHILLVGGTAETTPQIVRIDLGPSLASDDVPTSSSGANVWGNIGNLAYPVDFYMFSDNGHWYGFTTNFENNTITRFDFGSDFSVMPVGTNLGTIGGLNNPTGICAIQDEGNWYVYVTNEADGTITRMDFGTSLLNTPTAVNLPNPSGVLHKPRDLTIIHDCGGTFGLVVNNESNDIARIRLDKGVQGPITGETLGSLGNLSFPHSISTLFREGTSLYSFITNVSNHTMSAIVFSPCTESSIASSNVATPPAFSYNKAGTYTVNVLMDELLTTQRTFCKNIVVLDPPVVPLTDQIICPGTQTTLDATAAGTTNRYLWNNNAETPSITVSSGDYSVAVFNGGCTTEQPVAVTEYPALLLSAEVQSLDCKHLTGSLQLQASGGTAPYEYFLDNVSQPGATIDPLPPGTYKVHILDTKGCVTQDVDYTIDQLADILKTTASSNNVTCAMGSDGGITVQLTSGEPPLSYAIDGGAFQASNSWNNLAAGPHQVVTKSDYCYDTLQVTIQEPAPVALRATSTDEACGDGRGSVLWDPQGGTAPYTVYWNGDVMDSNEVMNLSAGTYPIRITDVNGCGEDTAVVVVNNNTERINILTRDTTINIGESVPLVAENNAPDFQWIPATGLSCDICATTIATPLQPTTYVLETLTGKNCITKDTVKINLSYNERLIIPNAFSPNGDGQNDIFMPSSLGIANYHLSIYNRWGNLLFDSLSPKLGWDGTVNGRRCDIGSYVYMIQYSFFSAQDKKLLRKGTVTLVK